MSIFFILNLPGRQACFSFSFPEEKIKQKNQTSQVFKTCEAFLQEADIAGTDDKTEK